jgi:molybdopterin-guanine dinucleotide biosynthesis protein MobB
LPEAAHKAISLVGPSGSGKTELICRLLSWFASQGLKVAVLKHSHKSSLGDESKDTGRFRRAGATVVALAAPGLLQINHIVPEDPPLAVVLEALAPGADLILVEGYKSGPLPKIAVMASSREPLPDYPRTVALICREPRAAPLPVFLPHQVAELGAFILEALGRT